jgi:outer membrane protein OmpA-like peptidoglycan-associated protein
MNIRNSSWAIATAVAAVLAACASAPTRNNDLEMARTAVQQVESSPDAGKYAAAEVTAAHDALRNAEALAEKKKSAKDIQQAAYLAKRHADIAAEQISRGQAEQKAAQAEGERQKVILEARAQEANNAKAQAQDAKAQAQLAQQQALSAQQQAEQNAQLAEKTAAEARLKQAALEEQLRDLQAKQTDRGLVLTLGDVLFDSGQATLKPGAMGTIDRLATFLNQTPERSVTIEGHTDSMGSDTYNMSLSENRANSVKAALTAKGIPADRIVAVGKGEGVPVASNDNSAGRQQNRRVEIIVSNPPAVAGR